MLSPPTLKLFPPKVNQFKFTYAAFNHKMTSRLNHILQLCSRHPRLILGTTISLGAAVYLANLKLKIEKTCRPITLSDLPSSSASRNFVEKARYPVPQPVGWAWGLERGLVSFLSPWSDPTIRLTSDRGEDDEREKTYWIPSFLALEVELPVELLSGYTCNDKTGGGESKEIFHLSQIFLRAFLDARSKGLETYLLDRDVPPLNFFEPGRRLFGREEGLGAFLLGTWFVTKERSKWLQGEKLPEGVAQMPVCESPSNTLNEIWEENDKEAAGAVMYWRVPAWTAAVRYRIPWRFMDGGFQEFMVERVDKRRARLVYVLVEVQGLYPNGVKERDFRKMSWLGYWGHAVYGRWLLWKTVKRLEKVWKPIASG
ncbi:hypothetical protein QBC36DRAFT_329751 [Triangularia setosa]|uniref:Uncharacterized protein n=1 Tax=Triangularia setosa TaxID=2587417 RepID=A0AAN6W677_9PEZI|nr:hypothetical protein QBC36DRAFT_329751 [Podospora setosa]